MKLTAIAANQTEVEMAGGRVFFSYNTPVAAIVDGQAYRTDKAWSRTTSKHINKWLDGRDAETRPQEFFDKLTLSTFGLNPDLDQ